MTKHQKVLNDVAAFFEVILHIVAINVKVENSLGKVIAVNEWQRQSEAKQ